MECEKNYYCIGCNKIIFIYICFFFFFLNSEFTYIAQEFVIHLLCLIGGSVSKTRVVIHYSQINAPLLVSY